MKNIFISLSYSLIGLALVGWVSVLFISIMIAGPDADSNLVQYFADNIIVSSRLEDLGYEFYDVSKKTFVLVSHMLITLLSTTILFSLGWSVGSHFLNIDAPGKAKIYFIHWIIFTGIFVASLFGITYFFTQTTTYEMADYIGPKGYTIITLLSVIYFFLMYYLSVMVGTARFARSSVLFANKLPGNL